MVFTPGAYVISEGVYSTSESTHAFYTTITRLITSKSSYEIAVANLQKENDLLKEKLAILNNKDVAMHIDLSTDSASSTNAIVQEAQTVGQEVETLFRPLSTLYDSFLITRGFEKGIKEGDVVYNSDYKPVGVVEEVHGSFSKVMLLSKPGNELEGFLKGATATSSLLVRLTGDGGGDFIATVPKDISVSGGDVIFWKAHPAMQLGEIISVENEPQSVSQIMHVRGAYSVTSRERLYVDVSK